VGRGGLGATEARRARPRARALEGPRGEEEASRASGEVGRGGLGATEARRARPRARALDGPPGELVQTDDDAAAGRFCGDRRPPPSVKEPHLAGRWYPAEPDALARTVRALLAAGKPPRAGVLAVIVPHAAYRYSGATAGRGLAAAGPGFRRFLVIAPSHFARFR